MFESLATAANGTSGAGAVEAWSRAESAACARRVAAMAAMFETARAADGADERDLWCTDTWDAVAAHIGAALRITHGAASNQLLIAVALHERFPLVAAVFAEGLITYQLVKVVVQRGALVVDPDALHELDRLLAEALSTREPMSMATVEKTVDAFVAQVDPQAVHRTETRARGRSVDVGEDDGGGMATVFATLFATDAKAFDTRIDALARTVCPGDPRIKDQRRADAIGALAHGYDRLACLCETDDCSAGDNPPSTGVVVYVIASADTIEERPTPAPPAATPPPAPDVPDDSAPDVADRSSGAAAQAQSREVSPGHVHQAATRTIPHRGPHPGHGAARQHPARRPHGWTVPARRDRVPGRARGDDHPNRSSRPGPTGTPIPTVEEAGRLRPVPRHDVPVPGLPRAGHEL